MISSAKPPKLETLSSACVMLQPSQYPVMHTRDTGLVARACEFLQVHEWRPVHLSPTSNPLLAETFEMPRLKFISEKVSHHPVIMAYHAEGEGWELYATSAGKTKFWGAWRPDA